MQFSIRSGVSPLTIIQSCTFLLDYHIETNRQMSSPKTNLMIDRRSPIGLTAKFSTYQKEKINSF